LRVGTAIGRQKSIIDGRPRARTLRALQTEGRQWLRPSQTHRGICTPEIRSLHEGNRIIKDRCPKLARSPMLLPARYVEWWRGACRLPSSILGHSWDGFFGQWWSLQERMSAAWSSSS